MYAGGYGHGRDEIKKLAPGCCRRERPDFPLWRRSGRFFMPCGGWINRQKGWVDMASKFMSDMPLAGMEAQMQQVPGFKPRKCGMSVSRLELTQARGGCSGKAETQLQSGNTGTPLFPIQSKENRMGGTIMREQQIFGYIRVSAKDQNIDRQLDALAPLGIPKRNRYIDKQSGKDFDRPAWRRLVKRLRPGDLLCVKSIDRLGRDYQEIIEQWRMITKERQADIRVMDMPLLDTTYGKDLLGTFIADLTLQVLSFAAQLERENIRQRQAEGIASAKARGVRFGRKKKELPEDFDIWFARWRSGEITGKQMADHCGMEISVLYRKLREAGISLD